ncbi:hypothetical protein DFH08DRAFT_804059 [Mycena albidolilacea]|uniref:Uncharacterized protein n=1 Tax=Mycena albidolilacea TaxID=1033008 RepID=A0AAD7EVX2_9AGAR|nr:hypothetical protein DFH08DRAFT_804059 [Mycena albidolilacea]
MLMVSQVKYYPPCPSFCSARIHTARTAADDNPTLVYSISHGAATPAPPTQPVQHLQPQAHGDKPAVQQAEDVGVPRLSLILRLLHSHLHRHRRAGEASVRCARVGAVEGGLCEGGCWRLAMLHGHGVSCREFKCAVLPLAKELCANLGRGLLHGIRTSRGEHRITVRRGHPPSGSALRASVGLFARQKSTEFACPHATRERVGRSGDHEGNANDEAGCCRGIERVDKFNGARVACHQEVSRVPRLVFSFVLESLSSVSMEPYACTSNGKAPEVVWEP